MSAATRAPETRAAVERARALIEQSRELGELPEDPLLLYSVLYGMWVANLVAFNGDMMRELATQFLALAETQSVSGPIMIGHRQMGLSLLHTGRRRRRPNSSSIKLIALYDLAEHRPLATQFGQDVGAASLSWRSIAWWLLGHPDAALADTERALSVARETQHLATLVYVINFSIWLYIHCGNYSATKALVVTNMATLAGSTGVVVLEWMGNDAAGVACSALTGNALWKQSEQLRVAGRVPAGRDGNNDVDAVVFIPFGESQRGDWPVRRSFDQDWRSNDCCEDDERELVSKPRSFASPGKSLLCREWSRMRQRLEARFASALGGCSEA